jgi:hypothetical protein
MLKTRFKVIQQQMLHDQCSTCRSTVYSFRNTNWLVVTLSIFSVSSTYSTQFHQQTEWKLQCKTTHVKKLNFSCLNLIFVLFPWRNSPQWATVSSLLRLHDHRHITFGRIPLDEWSARRRDHYLTTHNTHIHAPSGFEPVIPASERPQTHALDRAATGIGLKFI